MKLPSILLIALLFVPPLFAQSWRSWLILSVLVLIPALLFLLGVFFIDGVLFLDFVVFGALASAGSATRAISLLAAESGHNRPYSLWIELVAAVLFFVFTLNWWF